MIGDNRSASFMNLEACISLGICVTAQLYQLGLNHGAVTNACVSQIAPALPEQQQRTEVNIMKKLLLATAGVVAITGGALANGNGNGNGGPHHRQTVQDYYAAALAVSIGEVNGNSSTTSGNQANSAALRGSFTGFRGVANLNQNAGANSAQQNAVAISYIEGCDCEVTFNGNGRPSSTAEVNANAVAVNLGQVVGNSSQNGNGHDDRGHDNGGPRTSASATMNGSFDGAQGIAQVNQNAGANSLQQNSTAVARVENSRGKEQSRDAWAISFNAGQVTGSGNQSTDSRHDASAAITGSFNTFTGVANVNQNAGANSLMQNSSALSSITYCNCAVEDLSTTIAAAGNLGSVAYNSASAHGGTAGVSMANSFNGAQGVAQVSQNAGANSMMQNAVAIGAVYQRTN